jgi:hypothetical protein
VCVQDWQDRRKNESDILMKRETDRAWAGGHAIVHCCK